MKGSVLEPRPLVLAAYDPINLMQELLWSEYEAQLSDLKIDEDQQRVKQHRYDLDLKIDGNRAE